MAQSSNDIQSNHNVLNIGTLLKFINSYDGNPDDLSSYLTNCDRAFSLAQEDQKPVIFAYIQNKLTDKAQYTCANTVFGEWKDLKEFLKTRFGNRKHQTHLLLELQNCRQSPNETVAQYIFKIESCLKKLLSSIKQSCTNNALLAGQVESTNQLALHTFIIGVNSQISNILRSREPESLNEAFNIALEEEKFNILVNSRNKVCNKCNKPGHTSFNCRRFPNNFPNRNRPIYNLNPQVKVCKYCKKEGHLVETCFKLQNRQSTSNAPRTLNNSPRHNNNRNQSGQRPNVNTLNSQELSESAAPTSLENAIQALSL